MTITTTVETFIGDYWWAILIAIFIGYTVWSDYKKKQKVKKMQAMKDSAPPTMPPHMQEQPQSSFESNLSSVLNKDVPAPQHRGNVQSFLNSSRELVQRHITAVTSEVKGHDEELQRIRKEIREIEQTVENLAVLYKDLKRQESLHQSYLAAYEDYRKLPAPQKVSSL